MKKAVYVLCVISILAVLLPFVPSDYWLFRIFEFPLVQIASLVTLSLIGASFYFSRKNKLEVTIIISLVAALVYLAFLIFPYTPIAPYSVLPSDREKPHSTISVLSANIYMKNRETERLISTVEKYDPDLVLLLEPDTFWQRKMSPLREAYPFRLEVPQNNTYGLLFYSKLELIEPEVKYLIKPDIPSVFSKVKLKSGELVQIYAVHPEPPTPTESKSSTERDGELLTVGKLADESSLPKIVFGDLNDVAWSETTSLFQEVSKLLDPRKGRGFYNTFNAKYPLLRWPLDHVFHSENFKLIEMKRLDEIGSDHFPIYFELSLEPEAAKQQEEPQASKNDEEKASKKIDKAKEKE